MANVEAKKDALKSKFKEWDRNGDGFLNFSEFSALLSRGRNRLNEREMQKLFKNIAGRDGKVDFDEFVEYCYKQEQTSEHSKMRTTGGRHERLSQSTLVSTDTDDDGLWDAVREIYESYAGNDDRFEGRDFMKLCNDCKLFDSKFTRPDVDLLFAKYKAKGQNTIGFESLQQCIRGIALKKGVPTSDVQSKIAAKKGQGPSRSGVTEADYVKFHDDKSQYTGMHTHNENHGPAGSDEISPGARHERLKQQESYNHDDEDEADWGMLEESFYAFCNGIDGVGDNMLDSREFKQLCEDCNLYVKNKFTVADGDIVFNKVKNKGERRIGFDQFKDGCIGIARKRGCKVSQVQEMISAVHGPKGRGTTKADYVRFHDDKNTYTGMHAY